MVLEPSTNGPSVPHADLSAICGERPLWLGPLHCRQIIGDNWLHVPPERRVLAVGALNPALATGMFRIHDDGACR